MSFKEEKYEIIRNVVHPEVIRFIQLNFDIHEYAGFHFIRLCMAKAFCCI